MIARWLWNEVCTKERSLREAKRALRRGLKEHAREKKPLAYIIGTQPFGGYHFKARAPILIPRWETEEWTHVLFKRHLKNVKIFGGSYEANFESLLPERTDTRAPVENIRILDICAGSGCVGISVAAAYMDLLLQNTLNRVANMGPVGWHLTLVDVNADATALCRENIHFVSSQMHEKYRDIFESSFGPKKGQLYLSSLIEKHFVSPFRLVVADIFDGKALGHLGKNIYDLIVSNPPYIPSHQVSLLPPSVKNWEDVRALDGMSPSGTLFHQRILSLSEGLIDWHKRARNMHQVKNVVV